MALSLAFAAVMIVCAWHPDHQQDFREFQLLLNVSALVVICISYKQEEKLKEEDEDVLMTQVLRHHPCSAVKIGCGMDYFKVVCTEPCVS